MMENVKNECSFPDPKLTYHVNYFTTKLTSMKNKTITFY